MFKLDSRLLQIFYYVYKLKNVSAAADALGMSQPAVSNCLNKIRQHFNDPLFLRVGNEMLPTELAKQIFSPISEIINKIETQQSLNSLNYVLNCLSESCESFKENIESQERLIYNL